MQTSDNIPDLEERIADELFDVSATSEEDLDNEDPSYSRSTNNAATKTHSKKKKKKKSELPKKVCPFQKISLNKKIKFSGVVDVCIPHASHYPATLIRHL